MGALVGLLGLAGLGLAAAMLVVRFIFKKGLAYKNIGVLAGVAMTLFVVGLIITPSIKENFNAGREAGRQAATEADSVSSSEPSSPNVESNQSSPEQEQENKSEINQALEKWNTKVEQPIIDIPGLLQLDYSGVVNTLGEPASEEDEGENKYITYSLPDFDIEIRILNDIIRYVSVIPLKEYRYAYDPKYISTETPDDVMRLLKELGFNYPTALDSSITMKVFSYVKYGDPLREYEIQVSSADWKAVDRGEFSRVRQVGIRLID